jgi:hypothetical protein
MFDGIMNYSVVDVTLYIRYMLWDMCLCWLSDT